MTAPDQDAPTDAPTTSDSDVQVVPPVVVVMVVHDPGDWFEETLASVAAQQYANCALLVIDTGTRDDTASRIAQLVPDAHYRRVDPDTGFGRAANEAERAVQGAAFYLICHDDVRLEPNTVQVLVEEAFRSNAGIVGPKLVDWSDPDRLLSVGMSADKTGYPAPYVERGELDQAQHDAVRDSFYIPGAAMLVRADLFAALGGFDEGISFHGDDLDLCWRAQVAGARVVVAPAARVAHMEALGVRRPVDDRRRLQMRHRLRAMRVSSTFWTRVRVVPQAAALALLEILYALVLGRLRHARDVAGAWLWNARHRGEIRRQRKALSAIRTTSDRDVRRMQVRGSARLSAFLRGQIGSSEDRLLSLQRTREVTETLRSSKARTAVIAWAAVAAVLLIGSRDLIFGRIAHIGDIPILGDSAITLVKTWISGYSSVGLGAVAPNPTGLGFIGGLGVLFFNGLTLLTKVLVLGTLPLGAAGIWRLTKPVGSRRSRIVALVIYVALPLPYNAIAAGQWNALIAYAFAPWIVGQLAKASQLAPYGRVGGDAGPGVRHRPLLQRVVAVGVLTALAAMASEAMFLLTPALAVAVIVGGLLSGTVKGIGRVLVVAVGGTIVALVLQLPWSTGLVNDDWSTVLRGPSGSALDFGAIVRFHTGPIGSGVLSYLFLGAAALALFIGRQWRLGWAVRAWALILGSYALAFAQAQGWLPFEVPPPDALLVPAGVGVALAAAMGMAAFEVDLPDYHFGWRQILSVLAGGAFVLSVLPVVGATIDGRWDMPRGDYPRALGFVDQEGEQEPFRVLWMGEPALLPLASWPLDERAYGDAPSGQFAFATSDNGMPALDDRWRPSELGATQQLADVLTIAGEGGTSRLGALLAPMGVRYIAVPRGLAPEPAPITSDAATIVATLDAQLDLSPVTTAGVLLYRNNAWGPSRALVPPNAEPPSGGPALRDRFFPEVEGAAAALPNDDGPQSFSGSIDEPSDVYLAEAESSRWQLEVEGERVERDEALGWANIFHADTTGEATLTFATPVVRYLMLIGQVLLWVIALVYLLRVRVVTDERRSLDEPIVLVPEETNVPEPVS